MVGMRRQGERGMQDTGVFVYLIRSKKQAASGPDSQGHVTSWPVGSLTEDGEHPGRQERRVREYRGCGALGSPPHLPSGEPRLSV